MWSVPNKYIFIWLQVIRELKQAAIMITWPWWECHKNCILQKVKKKTLFCTVCIRLFIFAQFLQPFCSIHNIKCPVFCSCMRTRMYNASTLTLGTLHPNCQFNSRIVLQAKKTWNKNWQMIVRKATLCFKLIAIQQMRQLAKLGLARGSHGNLTTGQTWYLSLCLQSGKTSTYHLTLMIGWVVQKHKVK